MTGAPDPLRVGLDQGSEVSFSTTGGARIGWVNASWPFAKLDVSASSLTVSSGFFGTYAFTPAQVVALEPYGVIPLIGRGVKIVHGHPEYPAKIIFWCFGDPERLIARIRGVGFVPSCSSAATAIGRGIPVRWASILAAVVLWNALFILDGFLPGRARGAPGPLVIAAMAVAFLCAHALPRSTLLQSLVLKEGRSVDEIRAPLALLRLVTGLLLLSFLVTYVVARSAG